MKRLNLALITASLAALVSFGGGCDGGDDSNNPNNNNNNNNNTAQECESAADCAAEEVCLAYGDKSVCTITCEVSATECTGNASCAGVGAMSVDVCQPPESPGATEPTAEDPPEADEQPRLPCKSDAECDAIQPGLICAEWRGQRDCTLPCTNADQCVPPAVGGITMRFLTCGTDEGNTARMACIPDETCFNTTNPMACMEFDFPDF